jgi:pimeloyl-ACP methyl ester carboxylesterase
VNAEPGRIVAAQELFRSEDLLVRRIAGFGGPICYITFASYTDERTLDRPGFGEEHFRGRGIDAIHILSRENRWYQHPELMDALAAVVDATAGYQRVIAYGSSMGGFAALRYGAACGATVGLALSPQYSVDPAVAPFDQRWADDVARVMFLDDTHLPTLPAQYIAYDPRDPYDRRHFDLFAARSLTNGVPVPHGGHPVGSYLVETEMMRRLLEGIESGGFDHKLFARNLRRRRRRSGHYFYILAHRMPPHRPRQKVALARLAVETQDDNPLYRSQFGNALDVAGDFDAGYRVHQEAIAMSHSNMFQIHYLMLHHELRGEYDRAIEIGDRLIAENPEVLWLLLERKRVRRKRRHTTWLGRLGGRLGMDGVLERWLY